MQQDREWHAWPSHILGSCIFILCCIYCLVCYCHIMTLLHTLVLAHMPHMESSLAWVTQEQYTYEKCMVTRWWINMHGINGSSLYASIANTRHYFTSRPLLATIDIVASSWYHRWHLQDCMICMHGFRHHWVSRKARHAGRQRDKQTR